MDLINLHAFTHGFDYDIAIYFVVPVDWIMFLYPVKLSIILSIADMNPSRHVLLPTIKHTLLIFQSINFLIITFFVCFIPPNGTSIVIIQRIYKNILFPCMIIFKNIICYNKPFNVNTKLTSLLRRLNQLIKSLLLEYLPLKRNTTFLILYLGIKRLIQS